VREANGVWAAHEEEPAYPQLEKLLVIVVTFVLMAVDTPAHLKVRDRAMHVCNVLLQHT
jgi:hypothetical protein